MNDHCKGRWQVPGREAMPVAGDRFTAAGDDLRLLLRMSASPESAHAGTLRAQGPA
jgi:hypothetical protein